MLASTGDVTWMIGVSCTRLCDFKRGCDGELPDTRLLAARRGPLYPIALPPLTVDQVLK